MEELFVQFKDYLESKGLIFNEGQLVDASFIPIAIGTTTPTQYERRKRKKRGWR